MTGAKTEVDKRAGDMTNCEALEDPEDVSTASLNGCPRWCITRHGVQLGEEDWIHNSEPVPVADGLVARLCMSIDPDTGIEDGPYVLVGSSELTANEARQLGESLIRLATAGQ